MSTSAQILNGGTTSSYSSSGTSETTVSKTYDWMNNIVCFMTLTPDQVNKFEGIVTIQNNFQGITFEQKIYLQITALGDYIINPIILTTEVSQETDKIYIELCKITHNESDDILLVMFASHTDSYTPTIDQITIEGTTNSPTDYDILLHGLVLQSKL